MSGATRTARGTEPPRTTDDAAAAAARPSGFADLLLAVDCGTQSLRALVFDAAGTLLARRRVEYPPYLAGEPGRAEQDPEVWWRALVDACRSLASGEPGLVARLAAVAVTTQRDTMVCLDEGFRPLRNAIGWLDTRKTPPPYRPGLVDGFGIRIVGMTEALMRTQESGKCNWIMREEPELWDRTRWYVQVSGFLNARLTGEMRDSVASQIGHVPFDYPRLRWASARHRNARMFPVDPAKLPPLVQSGEVLGRLRPAAAAETGLPPGIAVVAAGSDKGCETLGVGVLGEDEASLSFGTTATVQTTSLRYREPLRFMPAFPALVPGRYNPEIEIFRGYWMVTWFKQQFAYEEVLEAERRGIAPEAMLDELLARTPPGAHGLVMQPYWTPGLKTPAARGAIVGFGDVHDRAHVYRAIIEGLAFGLREGLGRIERNSGTRVRRLAVSGGASQSDRICRIACDVFGLPVERGRTHETSGLGAAMCAAAALGFHPSVEAASRAMGGTTVDFEPDPAAHDLYSELYERVYRRLYRALSPLYAEAREITGYPEKPLAPEAARAAAARKRKTP